VHGLRSEGYNEGKNFCVIKNEKFKYKKHIFVYLVVGRLGPPITLFLNYAIKFAAGMLPISASFWLQHCNYAFSHL
jgi:hypothetical protein